MARAKRTVRTDARRRYRAEQAAMGIEPAGESTEAADEPSSSRGRGASTGGSSPAVARPSISRALRDAYRPVDVRADVRALPRLALHWSVLAATALAVVSTAVFILEAGPVDLNQPTSGGTLGAGATYASLGIQMFVGPPPAAGAFLIGFFAKRGSWLAGLLYGIVAGLCYAALLMVFTKGVSIVDIIPALVIAPVSAMLFASAAAWYRRFLDLVNPNRGRRPTRPQQGRGGSRSKDRPVAATRRR